MKHYDYLIVGAGLFGATFAYRAAQARRSCLVIDRRTHIGGNCHCTEMEGITVHEYGPHIFHTSNRRVWQFVNSMVEFTPFVNAPLAKTACGRLLHLPFNMNTFYWLWGAKTPQEAQAIIDAERNEARQQLLAQGIDEPRNLEEQALILVGRDIYEALIKGYTEKQWGRPCSQLPAFIIRRLPVRFTFNNNYFNDPYQGIPVGGYNRLVEKLLAHADVELCEDFFTDRRYFEANADRIIYTGPLDQYFDYCEGRLDWRSLRFEHEVIDAPNYQGNAVINYINPAVPYTRIVEHKHFDPTVSSENTVITREYPRAFSSVAGSARAEAEPYYPINDDRNTDLATIYLQKAARECNVLFGGRLAEYRYYDMDAVIANALAASI